MRITKRQLRRIIKEEKAKLLKESAPFPMRSRATSEFAAALKGTLFEECPMTDPIEPAVDVPSPEDYTTTRNMLAQNPEMMETGIAMVMDLAGTTCERSTAQAIIDHLQDMLHGAEEEVFPYTDDDIVDSVGDMMGLDLK